MSPIKKEDIYENAIHATIKEHDIYSYASTHAFSRNSTLFEEIVGKDDDKWTFEGYRYNIPVEYDTLEVDFTKEADFKLLDNQSISQPNESKEVLSGITTTKGIYPRIWNLEFTKHKNSENDRLSFKAYAGDISLSKRYNGTNPITGEEYSSD